MSGTCWEGGRGRGRGGEGGGGGGGEGDIEAFKAQR